MRRRGILARWSQHPPRSSSHPLGREAAIIAEVTPDPPGLVVLETAFGGSRVVDMLAGDPLPRIC